MKIRSTKAFKDAVNVAFDTQTMKFTAAAERVRLPLGQRSGYHWGKSPPTFRGKVGLPFGGRSGDPPPQHRQTAALSRRGGARRLRKGKHGWGVLRHTMTGKPRRQGATTKLAAGTAGLNFSTSQLPIGWREDGKASPA